MYRPNENFQSPKKRQNTTYFHFSSKSTSHTRPNNRTSSPSWSPSSTANPQIMTQPRDQKKTVKGYTGAAEGKEKWGSNRHPWRAREREPIMGVCGRSPQRGSRGRAPGGGQGTKPPAADEVFVFKTVIYNVSAAVLHEMMYCLSCFFCKVCK